MNTIYAELVELYIVGNLTDLKQRFLDLDSDHKEQFLDYVRNFEVSLSVDVILNIFHILFKTEINNNI
jgi:hypothetical protein